MSLLPIEAKPLLSCLFIAWIYMAQLNKPYRLFVLYKQPTRPDKHTLKDQQTLVQGFGDLETTE